MRATFTFYMLEPMPDFSLDAKIRENLREFDLR